MTEELKVYWGRSQKYWRQALEHLEKGEREKATELAWGSLVEYIHALALIYGKRLGGGHQEMKVYVRDIASQLGDEEIFRLFQRAEAAHANFYRGFMADFEVKEVLAGIQKLMEKIQRAMPANLGGILS